MNSQDIQELSVLKELIKEAAAVFLKIQPSDLVVTCARKVDKDTNSSKWLAGVFKWQKQSYMGLVQVGQEEEENFQNRRDACLALLNVLEETIVHGDAFQWEDEEIHRKAGEERVVVKIEAGAEEEPVP